jgi:hypothetical protein
MLKKQQKATNNNTPNNIYKTPPQKSSKTFKDKKLHSQTVDRNVLSAYLPGLYRVVTLLKVTFCVFRFVL